MMHTVAPRRSFRQLRVRAQLEAEVRDILSAYAKTESAALVVLSAELNRDGSLLTVTITCHDDDDWACVLTQVSPVRHQLARRLSHMRYLPKLRFVRDEGREADRLALQARLAEIAEQLGPEDDAEDSV